MQLTCGSLRGLEAFFWLWVYTALKPLGGRRKNHKAKGEEMRKNLLISLVAALAVIFIIIYIRPLTLQTYVLYGSGQSKWITIDYGHEDCPALTEILF